MNRRREGTFRAAHDLETQLRELGASANIRAMGEQLAAGAFEMPGYVRPTAPRALVGFCEACHANGLQPDIGRDQIVAFLDTLDAIGSAQKRRTETKALEKMTRELSYPWEILDGFERRLPDP